MKREIYYTALGTFRIRKEPLKGKYPVVFSNGVGAFHNAYKAKGPGVITGRSGTIGKVHYISTYFSQDNPFLPKCP